MRPHRLLMLVRMVFYRRQAGMELDNELQFHIDQQISENIDRGMNREEARRAALRTFGNPATLRDQTRNTWNWLWLEYLLQDLKHVVRTLIRTPGFSLLAMVVMSLGIGANVALFTVVRSVLLKPLPFKGQDRLVRLFEANSQGIFQDNVLAGGTFSTWQSRSTSFEGMAIKRSRDYNLTGDGGQLPEVVHAQMASWTIFPVLGAEAALGRFFLASDDTREANATVVLTWGLWKRRYGGDPSILGKTILLDANAYTVLGVLPAWFTYPDPDVQLWTPLYHERSHEVMKMYTAHNFDGVARLKPGVTMQQASAELNAIQRQIRQQNPDGPVNDAANIRPILDAEVYQLKTGLYALLAATGCLLLIACLNVANLLVARAASRRKETAIRTALGGSRARLLREQVMESLVLSAAGGGLGLILAGAALQWLIRTRHDLPRATFIHMDALIVFFAVGVVLICGVLAGLVPALSSDDREILGALHESSRSHSASQGGVRLRRTLLVLQVGLTVVLLTGAGLLIKTYSRLRSVSLGCATHNVLTMEVRLPGGSYKTPEQLVSFFEQLLVRIRQLPGVEDASFSTLLPGQGHNRDDVFTIREHPSLPKGETLDASTCFIAPNYFRAMQVPLLQGRAFRPDERLARARTVMVNQVFVQKFLKGEDPIGKHITNNLAGDLGTGREGPEIIGVTADTLEEVSAPPFPTIFFPLYAGTERGIILVLRSVGGEDLSTLALPVQRAISGLDPTLPVSDILSMDQIIQKSTRDASFDAVLLVAFATLSLALAAVGLFGVLSYLVGQRTTEIGIRIALGAGRQQVLRLVLVDGMRPALFGLVLGLIASAAVTRLIQSLLYDTKPLDPVVFMVVTATLLTVAFIACAIPAWRASRLDPMQALRSE